MWQPISFLLPSEWLRVVQSGDRVVVCEVFPARGQVMGHVCVFVYCYCCYYSLNLLLTVRKKENRKKCVDTGNYNNIFIIIIIIIIIII